MTLPLALLSTALACAAAPPAAYVPAPLPADTGETLVGAWMCPLWRQGCRNGREWEPLLAYPERQPLLGWYDEGSPEVTDWEITWARDHGISFFVPCWFRARDNLGQPARGIMEHWVRSLASARYRDQIRFAILWENLNPIACGVASEADLLQNLLPYWLQTFFTQPSYLVLDGKPVLFIYSVNRLVQELGGQEEAARAIAKMRQACREAGFQGLTLIGVHHQNPDDPLEQMAALGLDATSSYHWPTFSGRMPWPWEPAAVRAAQEDCWERQEQAASVPSILTVSMGWDDRPWGGRAGWQLSPEQFGKLCTRARERLERRAGARRPDAETTPLSPQPGVPVEPCAPEAQGLPEAPGATMQPAPSAVEPPEGASPSSPGRKPGVAGPSMALSPEGAADPAGALPEAVEPPEGASPSSPGRKPGVAGSSMAPSPGGAADPGTALGSRLLLIDNWNEFGEGHFVFPCREHGFAYLDALRAAFCDDPAPHTDLVPEDLGLGPYDSLLRATLPE